jgi:hypothetical protein
MVEKKKNTRDRVTDYFVALLGLEFARAYLSEYLCIVIILQVKYTIVLKITEILPCHQL